ncbi:peptide chain release factor H [Silvimonas iriomotensis]|uniref:peptide chain release factor H n=1 Tax=Silvimonas iriomotensis TaxID=449662 RepID=UPI00166839B5|nr:peptide chain release factor H [Silvimonas iriomotensis]
MVLLQLSAGQGPAECCRAVAGILNRLLAEATAHAIPAAVLETEAGPLASTLRSALISLDGPDAQAFAQGWAGSAQWICASPYRPRHARKNWFIGIAICETPASLPDTGIRFEACRASGPGGQHVNKTESAIRATHIASGISVRVETERSQHANKRLAMALLAHKLAEHAERVQAEQRAARRQLHHDVARGNPVRVFAGLQFAPIEGGRADGSTQDFFRRPHAPPGGFFKH